MKPNNRYILMSIFYRKELWHNLLSLIHGDIYGDQWLQHRVTFVLCFLNFHRGDNLRLLFKLTPLADEDTCVKIDAVIRKFLLANPSYFKEIALPITSCFKDIPANEIRYNSYDHNCLETGLLLNFQVTISKIISMYFSTHPFDNGSLFKVAVIFHYAIIKGLCPGISAAETCNDLIQILEGNCAADCFTMMVDESQGLKLGCPRNFFTKKSLPDHLSDVTELARGFYEQNNQRLNCYLLFRKILKQHLFNVEDQLFIDALRYIQSAKLVAGSTTYCT